MYLEVLFESSWKLKVKAIWVNGNQPGTQYIECFAATIFATVTFSQQC